MDTNFNELNEQELDQVSGALRLPIIPLPRPIPLPWPRLPRCPVPLPKPPIYTI